MRNVGYLLTCLVLISSHVSYADTSVIPFPDPESIFCSSASIYDIDEAHLSLVLPVNLCNDEILKLINMMIAETHDPALDNVKLQNSFHYGYEGLPVIIHEKKKFGPPDISFYGRSNRKEFVVLRPLKDCLGISKHPALENTYLYTRAFGDDKINVSIIRHLLDQNVEITPLTEQGTLWIQQALALNSVP